MPSRTTLARTTLMATTAVWFVLPMVGRLTERAGFVRFLAEFVGWSPLLALLALAAPLVAGTLLYPKCEVELRTRTLLPLVSLVLSLYGWTWLAMEGVTDDMGVVALAAPAVLGVLLLLAGGLLLPTRHFALAFTGPLFRGLLVLDLWTLHALEFERNQERGDRIVAALDAFRTRTGAYPFELEELVPADLDAVPRPNKWFWRGARYHYRPGGLGAGRAGDRPTTYALSYPTNGDFDVGSMRRTPFADWTWTPAFEEPNAFDPPWLELGR